jgi:hypothetical protein
MKLEEITRAALAEANYKMIQEKKLAESHVTEGENLELTVVDNKQRRGRKWRNNLNKGGGKLRGVGLVESFIESVTNEGPPLEYQRFGECSES